MEQSHIVLRFSAEEEFAKKLKLHLVALENGHFLVHDGKPSKEYREVFIEGKYVKGNFFLTYDTIQEVSAFLEGYKRAKGLRG